MELLNYSEIWVSELIDELLNERQDICKCELCRLDIQAMALNQLKPNYVVSEHGRVYTKTKMLGQQNRADIVAEVTKAIEQVSRRPHHLP